MEKDGAIMPIQPIRKGRFVPNRIVQEILNNSNIDLNDISLLNFTDQERMQFAQLIGYSVSGFGGLDYVDEETYDSVCLLEHGED